MCPLLNSRLPTSTTPDPGVGQQGDINTIPSYQANTLGVHEQMICLPPTGDVPGISPT